MTAAAVVEPELIDVPQSMTLPALNPLALLNKLIDKNPDPDQLGKMIALVETWKKQRAVEAYAVAMSKCQGEIPRIEKTAVNSSKNNRPYAPLEQMQFAAMPVINRNGFSTSYSQDPEPLADGRHHIVLDIFHNEGHRERLHGFYRLDGKGAKGGEVMSDIQGDVSTHTYAQKDMLRMAFSIQVGGLDRDGQGEGIDPKQMELLNTMIDEARSLGVSYDADKFRAWLQVKSFEELTPATHAKACDFLGRKIADAKAKAGAK